MQLDDDQTLLLDKARKLYDDHERRSVLFGMSLVRDPAWELLLSSFVHAHQPEGGALTLPDVNDAPLLLRKRWMWALADAGLMTLSDDHQSATLSRSGHEKMIIYLRSI